MAAVHSREPACQQMAQLPGALHYMLVGLLQAGSNAEAPAQEACMQLLASICFDSCEHAD
jgi:hypothetical protein